MNPLNRLSDLIGRFQRRYCKGIYRTFQQAQAAIPARRRVGYDNYETSRIYLDRLDWVKPSDYAIFYWLRPLLEQSPTVFDFGGNAGWSYYAFQKYLTYPPELRWLICDVPAVIETGREVAVKRQAPHLSFTTEFGHVEGHDILFTSGALQYVEPDLASLLAPLVRKPCHLLINRVPLSERPTFYTVQDITTSCCAYRIGNREEFVGSLQRLGYTLLDSWQCYESSCRFLFHPSRNLRSYTGMYFRLDTPASSNQTSGAG